MKNEKHETLFTGNCNAQFHPSYSNGKVGGKKAGVMAIGYMPGSGILRYNDGVPVTNCVGTCSAVDCSACVKQCYAVSMIKRYRDARKNRVENTLQLRDDINKHFDDIKAAILRDKIRIVRYTDSGEIESYMQFFKLVNLALELPSVRFYLYTKNYGVLREFFGRGNQFELPTNLVVLISIWEDLGEKEYNEFKNHRNIKAFAVKPATVKPQVMCPAYKNDPKTGRVKLNTEMTCAKCGLCIGTRGNADIIGCLEH